MTDLLFVALFSLALRLCGVDHGPAHAEESVGVFDTRLQPGHPHDRTRTARALRTTTPSADETVPSLLVALNDHHDEVRKTTQSTSGPVGQTELPGLIKALDDPDAEVRGEAADALGRLGARAEPAGQRLVKMLRDDRSDPARARAARALGLIGFQSAIPALTEAVKNDRFYLTRAWSAWGLMGFGQQSPGKVIPLLVETVKKDPHYYPRHLAIVALVHLGDPAIPALVGLLKGKKVATKESAIWALGEMAAVRPKAPAGLATASSALARCLDDPDPKIRAAAAFSLGQIGPMAKTTRSALEHACDDTSGSVRVNAAAALSTVDPGNKRAVPVLMAALRDKDFHVRRDAAENLGVLISGTLRRGGEAAVPALIDALKDPEAEVRHAAVQTLGWIGPGAKAAVKPLRRLKSRDPDRFGEEVDQALREIENADGGPKEEAPHQGGRQ